MPKEIFYTIEPDGSIHVEAKGFKGQKCIEESKKLMNGLEVTDSQITRKKEFYENESTTEQTHVTV